QLYDGAPVYLNRAYLERRTVSANRSPWARHPVEVTYRAGLCPTAEDLAARSIAVAIGADYSGSDVDDVATAVHKVADALL
ncbi:MAG TPA: hypothetical protein VNE21_07485, partial [Mycobacteriales bacterium]|nr:hypothetical protein [Mycobacteriales bacterium]